MTTASTAHRSGEDCEQECRKHEEHIGCKACANACADVVDQIKLVFAQAQATPGNTATG